ncbi:hypothetical protein FACS1894159_07930 [Bacteroidia bacterium]|nr:hypothetical protein FACS1894159_07930 [Bacteroidia bacterium]
MAVSCSKKYDDSALWGEVGSHADRLAALETWQAQVNSNISALQSLVNARQQGDAITGVTQFSTPTPGGYTITFSSSSPITIYNGDKGDTGATGAAGATGAKGDKGDTGATGAAGSTPQIGVAQYPTNSDVYYWTLNGSFILDASNNRIPVTGSKGDKGDTGNTGATGSTGATGPQGPAGQNGQTGASGADGADGAVGSVKANNAPKTGMDVHCKRDGDGRAQSHGRLAHKQPLPLRRRS